MIESVEQHEKTLELLRSAYKQGEAESKKLEKTVNKDLKGTEVTPEVYQEVIDYFNNMVQKHGENFVFEKMDEEMRYKYWRHVAVANKNLHDVLKRQIDKAKKNGVTEFDRATY